MWIFIFLIIYSFALANECSLVLARALGLPTASFWGFGYQGGEVKIIRELILDSDYLIKYSVQVT
jgi:hypothetical protein